MKDFLETALFVILLVVFTVVTLAFAALGLCIIADAIKCAPGLSGLQIMGMLFVGSIVIAASTPALKIEGMLIWLAFKK